jgi:hypothetical protein
MNFISISVLAILCLNFNSCVMQETSKALPGKIAFRNLMGSVCEIYEDSDSVKLKFKVRKDKKAEYDGFIWLNNRDYFLGTEYMPSLVREEIKGNVAMFDLSGNLIERIYESRNGENVGFTYPSRNDKRLLFTIDTVGDIQANPLEGLMRMQSIIVMDLQKKKIIKKIPNVGMVSNFDLCESPWLYDENRFVYSITSANKLVISGTTINPVDEATEGVYIYDISTDKKELLIPGGRFPIASPTSNQIAFIKERSVIVMNLKDTSSKIVYQMGSKETVKNIHWTPDGQYIYLVHFNYYMFNFFTSGEKLIEISTGKNAPFKKIGQGFGYYTWK